MSAERHDTTDTTDDDLEDVPVEDLHRANWVLGQIRAARRVLDEELECHRAERDRLSILETAAKARCARIEAWYAPQLESFHRALLRDDPKRKLVDLLNGSLKARKDPDRVEVDTDTFLAAGPLDDWLRVKIEADKPAILRHVKATGEVPPGVELVPGETRYSVVTER